jgi:N6-adenosine-specific RNA methylase IME4
MTTRKRVADLPILYEDAARRVAELVEIVEITAERDRAMTLRDWAHRRKDRGMTERVVRYERWLVRRIGQRMAEDRDAGRLAKGTKGQLVGFSKTRQSGKEMTLADQEVDKNLAAAARTAWAMDEAAFREDVEHRVRIALAAIDGAAEVIAAAREERYQKKLKVRRAREKKMALAMPLGEWGVIYADPEWQYEFWSDKAMTHTAAQLHYETSTIEAIKKRPIKEIAARDCALFLWATAPMLPQQLEVMAAWGFDYKSHCVWVKNKIGTGYWFRNKHELLLVGTRGSVPAPSEDIRWPSAIEAPVGRHSEKPDVFYELIEAYFPNLPKIELNARRRRDGWDSWGWEAPEAVA